MRNPLLFGILAILLLHDTSANLVLTPKPDLALPYQARRKRLHDTWQSFLTPDGWKISYITFEHLIPIDVAAAGLQQLYIGLVASAFTSQYNFLTLSNAVVCRLGSLNLAMWSNDMIPWIVVQAFAGKMWAVTDLGLNPGYSLKFVSPSGPKLRVLLEVMGIAM